MFDFLKYFTLFPKPIKLPFKLYSQNFYHGKSSRNKDDSRWSYMPDIEL